MERRMTMVQMVQRVSSREEVHPGHPRSIHVESQPAMHQLAYRAAHEILRRFQWVTPTNSEMNAAHMARATPNDSGLSWEGLCTRSLRLNASKVWAGTGWSDDLPRISEELSPRGSPRSVDHGWASWNDTMLSCIPFVSEPFYCRLQSHHSGGIAVA